MLKKFFASVVIALLSATYPLSASAQERTTAVLSYIPDKDQLPIIKLRVNANTILTLLVDTGTSTSLLSADAAERLGLTPQPALNDDGKPITIEGKPSKLVVAKDVLFGSFRTDIPFVLVNAAKLPHPGQEPLDGLIGSNVFQDSAVLFDFEQHRITMYGGGKMSAPELQTLGMKGAITIPQVKPETGVFLMAGSINDQSHENFLIDTGSYGTLLTTALARKLKLKLAIEPRDSYTFLGKMQTAATNVDKLTFERLTFVDQPADYPLSPLPDDYPMHIGMNLLRSYRMVLDFPLHTAYFQPATAYARSSDAAVSTLVQKSNDGSTSDGTAGGGDKKYQWHLRYQKGEVFAGQTKYVITTYPEGGQSSMQTVASIVRREVKQVTAGGDATVVVRQVDTLNDAFQTPFSSSPATPQHPLITSIYGKDGRLLKTTANPAGATPEFSRLLGSLSGNKPVPPMPVRSGENWQTVFPNPFFPDRLVVSTSTLNGVQKVDGRNTFCVQIKMSVPINEKEADDIRIETTYYVDSQRECVIREDTVMDNVPIAPTTGTGTVKIVTNTERVDAAKNKTIP